MTAFSTQSGDEAGSSLDHLPGHSTKPPLCRTGGHEAPPPARRQPRKDDTHDACLGAERTSPGDGNHQHFKTGAKSIKSTTRTRSHRETATVQSLTKTKITNLQKYF